MSMLIDTFLPFSNTNINATAAGTARSIANPGSSYTASLSMTFNAFRLYIVHWEFINPVTLTSCVVNGLNPTIITQTNVVQGSGGVGIALVQLRYPFSSSIQNFTMNFSSNVTAASIGSYTIFRNSNDTPYSFQTATKGTLGTLQQLGVPVIPRSATIIASTNLVNSSITMSVSPTPPTISVGYNLSAPGSSPQFQFAAYPIVNATDIDYGIPIVSVTSSVASGAYATVTYI